MIEPRSEGRIVKGSGYLIVCQTCNQIVQHPIASVAEVLAQMHAFGLFGRAEHVVNMYEPGEWATGPGGQLILPDA